MAALDLLAPTNLVGQSLTSRIWGGQSFPVTQDFGVPGARPDWYAYSADEGWPAGYHIGLDVGLPKGTAVYAPGFAHVEQAGWSDSFRPNPVTLVTEDDPSTPGVDESGVKIILGHLWSDAVRGGQEVKPGDLVGYSGEQTVLGTMTPDGSGPHLHLEIREASAKGTAGEVAVNPLPWVSGTPVAGDALETGKRIVDTGGASASTGASVGAGTGGWQQLAGQAGVYLVGLALVVVGVLMARR